MWEELDLLIKEVEEMYELMNPIIMYPVHSKEAREALRFFADLIASSNPSLSKSIHKRMDKTECISIEKLKNKEKELKQLLNSLKLQGYDVPNIPDDWSIH